MDGENPPDFWENSWKSIEIWLQIKHYGKFSKGRWLNFLFLLRFFLYFLFVAGSMPMLQQSKYYLQILLKTKQDFSLEGSQKFMGGVFSVRSQFCFPGKFGNLQQIFRNLHLNYYTLKFPNIQNHGHHGLSFLLGALLSLPWCHTKEVNLPRLLPLR